MAWSRQVLFALPSRTSTPPLSNRPHYSQKKAVTRPTTTFPRPPLTQPSQRSTTSPIDIEFLARHNTLYVSHFLSSLTPPHLYPAPSPPNNNPHPPHPPPLEAPLFLPYRPAPTHPKQPLRSLQHADPSILLARHQVPKVRYLGAVHVDGEPQPQPQPQHHRHRHRHRHRATRRPLRSRNGSSGHDRLATMRRIRC